MRFASCSRLIVAVFFVLACASPAFAQGWLVENVDPAGSLYGFSSIAIAPDHVVHVACGNTDGYLRYLSRINGVWQSDAFAHYYTTVEGSRGLRFGPDGRPRILATWYLYTQTESGWVRTTAPIDYFYVWAATAIDAQGVSRFCNIWWVSYTGYGDLTYETMRVEQNTFPMYASCEMEFASDGQPYIVAMLQNGKPVTLYSKPQPDGTWNKEEIEPGLYPAMAIDAADRVHVCYTRLNTGELVYALHGDNNQWVRVLVDAYGSHPSMAIAPNGGVNVSYYDVNHGLKYATKSSTFAPWEFSTVDTNAVGDASSIAVDGSSVHISYGYRNGIHDGLRYAVRQATATGVEREPSFAGASIRAIPNPFNPSTSMEYVVPVRGRVRVTVFDIAGRVVEKLVDRVRDAGSYRVQFTARASSGVYFARVEVGGQTATTKIVLLK